MAFTAHSGALKFGFILTVILFFLGLVTLGSLAKYGQHETGACLIFYNGKTNNQEKCTFSTAAGGVISLAALFLFGMDWVTWKRSENYKGRKASVATLFLAPAMCLFSFCTAIVIGLGIKSTCSTLNTCNGSSASSELKGIYTGISCAALAGLFYAIYAVSEYMQYQRRHVKGDKW